MIMPTGIYKASLACFLPACGLRSWFVFRFMNWKVNWRAKLVAVQRHRGELADLSDASKS